MPDEIAATLSAREVEVLLLLDEHLGTDDIAKRLFISEHTVRSHVKSLLHKLNVSSRRDALEVLAVARGWIPHGGIRSPARSPSSADDATLRVARQRREGLVSRPSLGASTRGDAGSVSRL